MLPPNARNAVSRYGIAEWFGKDITTMSPDERQMLGQISVKQVETGDLSEAPLCPFLSTLIPSARCNKKGGVCSLRKFALTPDQSCTAVAAEKIVTVCPLRFLQHVAEDKSLFVWISEKMLDVSNPTVIKETPFLRKVPDARRPVDATENIEVARDLEAEAQAEKKAGRIDWLLVNPATMIAGELEWCAVETQALYFSGNKMKPEFEAYAQSPSPLLFPVGKRRPDYRSSGPKRLSPQLDVKVPVLRNWGKKVAIVIDHHFYDNMNALDDAYTRARDERARRDNSDIVWFVVDYDDRLHLRAGPVVFTTLDSSRRALSATEPLGKVDFTNNLKRLIESNQRTNKVFKASE